MSDAFSIPPGEVEYRNTFRDSRGIEALKLGYREIVLADPDGNARVYKEAEYVALGDGRLFTAAMLGSGKYELAICELCRYPLAPPFWRPPERPSIGVMLRESGSSCASCSRFVCRLHARTALDGSVACAACAKRARWSAWLSWLFFEEE